MSIKRTKAKHLITESLGKSFQSQLVAKLTVPGSFFLVNLRWNHRCEYDKAVRNDNYIISEKDNSVITQLFDIVETVFSTAADLYNCLKTTITTKGIAFENLVGFSSDIANVMIGEPNSVFSRLRSELPAIVCMKCSCHMMHLAASKACLQLPRSVEDLLRNIGSHFSRSHYHYLQLKFKEFQEFFKTDIHKILSPTTTRWLSLKSCVDRVLEQYKHWLSMILPKLLMKCFM